MATHETSLRPGGRHLRYRLRNIPDGVKKFEEELRALIAETPIHIIASVVLKEHYFELYGDEPVDTFLPSSIYSLTLDFMMERSIHLLSLDNKGALGTVFAESRERREDALLQHEYVRLQLEGTQYSSDSWFRRQLHPTINFHVKDDNLTGLQIADLLARPIAEKALWPNRENIRWDTIKRKFYEGGQGRPESYGLKVFPHPVDREFFA